MTKHVVCFSVPGEPVGKGRARASVRHGQVHHYTPEKTETYERQVAAIARPLMAGIPLLEGPVQMKVNAVFGIPKSWSKARRLAQLTKAEWVTKKPDADNVFKIVADALNGIVWKDDSQVVFASVSKVYGDTPSVDVTIASL